MFEYSLVTFKPKLNIPQRLVNVAVPTGYVGTQQRLSHCHHFASVNNLLSTVH
jgi:hypothetical protein